MISARRSTVIELVAPVVLVVVVVLAVAAAAHERIWRQMSRRSLIGASVVLAVAVVLVLDAWLNPPQRVASSYVAKQFDVPCEEVNVPIWAYLSWSTEFTAECSGSPGSGTLQRSPWRWKGDGFFVCVSHCSERAGR